MSTPLSNQLSQNMGQFVPPSLAQPVFDLQPYIPTNTAGRALQNCEKRFRIPITFLNPAQESTMSFLLKNNFIDGKLVLIDLFGLNFYKQLNFLFDTDPIKKKFGRLMAEALIYSNSHRSVNESGIREMFLGNFIKKDALNKRIENLTQSIQTQLGIKLKSINIDRQSIKEIQQQTALYQNSADNLREILSLFQHLLMSDHADILTNVDVSELNGSEFPTGLEIENPKTFYSNQRNSFPHYLSYIKWFLDGAAELSPSLDLSNRIAVLQSEVAKKNPSNQELQKLISEIIDPCELKFSNSMNEATMTLNGLMRDMPSLVGMDCRMITAENITDHSRKKLENLQIITGTNTKSVQQLFIDQAVYSYSTFFMGDIKRISTSEKEKQNSIKEGALLSRITLNYSKLLAEKTQRKQFNFIPKNLAIKINSFKKRLLEFLSRNLQRNNPITLVTNEQIAHLENSQIIEIQNRATTFQDNLKSLSSNLELIHFNNELNQLLKEVENQSSEILDKASDLGCIYSVNPFESATNKIFSDLEDVIRMQMLLHDLKNSRKKYQLPSSIQELLILESTHGSFEKLILDKMNEQTERAIQKPLPIDDFDANEISEEIPAAKENTHLAPHSAVGQSAAPLPSISSPEARVPFEIIEIPRQIKLRQLDKILRDMGLDVLRQKGPHTVYGDPETNEVATVISKGGGGKTLAPGTIRSIQSELKEFMGKRFEEKKQK